MIEKDIQRIFPVFLREFYRYRFELMPDSVHSDSNARGEGNIIADGRIMFMKGDGTRFTCTFEATSADKIGEVKYSLNMVHFIWDCVTFSLAATMTTYALLFMTMRLFLYSLTPVGNIGMVIGLLLLFFTIFYFCFKSWTKYRYIYAIEQFKQYFADEQWVAIASDVFPSLSDPYMVELRKQCNYSGFGLAVVHENGEVNPLVTPSRLGIYGQDRKEIQWITDMEVYQGVSKSLQYSDKAISPLKALWNKISRPIFHWAVKPIKEGLWQVLTLPFGQKPSEYFVYMKGFNYQKIMSIGSVVILSFLCWKTIKTMPVSEIDGFDALTVYENRQKELGGQNPEDASGIVYDDQLPITYRSRPANHIPKQDPLPNTYNSSSTSRSLKPAIEGVEKDDDGVQVINLSGDEEEAEMPKATKPNLDTRTTAKSATKANKPTVAPLKTKDDCSIVKNKKGWVVQDNYFTSKDFADDRIKILQKAGLKGYIVQGSCLNRSSSGYVVLYTDIHKSEQNAVGALEKTRKILSKNKVAVDRMFIRALGD